MNPLLDPEAVFNQRRMAARQASLDFANAMNFLQCSNNQKMPTGVDDNPNVDTSQQQERFQQTFFRQWFETEYSSNVPPNNCNARSSVFENMHLKMELLNKYESLEFRAKLELRDKMPVMRQRNDILQAIRGHQVVSVVGDKGSGKSSQIPQILLDHFLLDCRGNECQIVCVEPTKMSVISLAERVACERNEPLGQSVGFQVRRESCIPRQSGSILYCTNLVLRKKLRAQPLMNTTTIFILDDISERNADTIQIMELLKSMLPCRPDLRILLLSTTVVDETFQEYFGNYYQIFIAGISAVVDLTISDGSEDDLSSDDISDHNAEGPVVRKSKEKAAYLNARKLLKNYKQLDPVSFTKKDKVLIKRSQQIVEKYKRINKKKQKFNNQANTHIVTKSDDTVQEALRANDCGPSTSTASAVIKRSLSIDESFYSAKKLRYNSSTDESETELQIAIIDLSDPHGRISPDKWLLIEAKLILDIASEKWSKDEVSFDSVNWLRGIKVITCHNRRSLEFLKTAIAEAKEIWPQANLKVVPRSTVPTYSYATTWIPPPVPPPEKILHLIEKQNDGIKTDSWQITPNLSYKKEFGKEFRLVIDGNSLRRIREIQGRIKFGLGSIRIRLHGFHGM